MKYTNFAEFKEIYKQKFIKNVLEKYFDEESATDNLADPDVTEEFLQGLKKSSSENVHDDFIYQFMFFDICKNSEIDLLKFIKNDIGEDRFNKLIFDYKLFNYVLKTGNLNIIEKFLGLMSDPKMHTDIIKEYVKDSEWSNLSNLVLKATTELDSSNLVLKATTKLDSSNILKKMLEVCNDPDKRAIMINQESPFSLESRALNSLNSELPKNSALSINLFFYSFSLLYEELNEILAEYLSICQTLYPEDASKYKEDFVQEIIDNKELLQKLHEIRITQPKISIASILNMKEYAQNKDVGNLVQVSKNILHLPMPAMDVIFAELDPQNNLSLTERRDFVNAFSKVTCDEQKPEVRFVDKILKQRLEKNDKAVTINL